MAIDNMPHMNCIVVFDKTKESVLFCHRQKEPYNGCLNFVGGKVEPGESSEDAAYRELEEETGIGRKQIQLYRLMDITYYHQKFVLEMYVGKLEEDVKLREEKNPLLWLPLTEDFTARERFAGEQNIAHIINVALKYPIPERSMMADGQYVGVDGCKGGWIAAVLDYGKLRVEFHETVQDIVCDVPKADAYLIDMAIGLPEKEEDEEKRPDRAAQKELGKFASSVFPIPCRQAVEVGGSPRDPQVIAKQRALNLEHLGKSLSAQTINIIPKIKELDDFLAEHSEYKNVLCESHPEVCFARLKGKLLDNKKKTSEGQKERKAVLSRYLEADTLDQITTKAKELRCKSDDIMDAVCLAVAAALKAHDLCETIPKVPEKDSRELMMQLVVPR